MIAVDVPAAIDAREVSTFQIRVFLLCGLVILLDGIDYQLIGITAPLIIRDMGIARSQLGWVFSAGTLGAVIGGIGCGLIADRLGRRRTLMWAALVFGAATMTTTQAFDLSSLVVLRFVTGLGLGGAVPCCIALTSEYAPRRRRAAIVSILWAAFPLGATVGGFVNANLIRSLTWQDLFTIWGVAPLLAAFVLWIWLPESVRFLLALGSGTDRIRTLLERMGIVVQDADTVFVSNETRVEGMALRNLFLEGRRAVTIPLWITLFIVLGSLTVLQTWTPALIIPLGYTPADAALILALNGLGSVIGTSSAGRLLERFGVARTVIPAFVLSAVAVVGFGMAGAETFWILAIPAIITGVVLGIGSSGAIALSALVYPTTIRSTGVGWAMGTGRLGAVAAPLGIGLMVAMGASVPQLFLAVAVALMAAIPCLSALAAYTRRAETVQDAPAAVNPLAQLGTTVSRWSRPRG